MLYYKMPIMLAIKYYDYGYDFLLLMLRNSVINIFTVCVVFIYILLIAHDDEW